MEACIFVSRDGECNKISQCNSQNYISISSYEISHTIWTLFAVSTHSGLPQPPTVQHFPHFKIKHISPHWTLMLVTDSASKHVKQLLAVVRYTLITHNYIPLTLEVQAWLQYSGLWMNYWHRNFTDVIHTTVLKSIYSDNTISLTLKWLNQIIQIHRTVSSTKE
jgi:hypothetical protein